jgi:type II secretory pathway pseudopilin PulG
MSEVAEMSRAEPMRTQAKRTRKSGMTLIEAIVAFAIVGIIIVVAVTGINTIANVNVRSQDMNVADEEMEALIARGEYASYQKVTMKVVVGEGADQVEINVPGRILTFVNEKNGNTLEVFEPD